MKRRNRMLAVCALFALLLAVCVPAFSVANADGDGTIIITISGTTTCYGDNGKQIGILNTDGNVQLTYRAIGSKEDIPVILLYTYTAEDSGLGADKLEGKVKASLQHAPTSTDTSPDTPDPNTSPATEVSATPLPELPSEVWVDASVVVSALNQAKQQDDSIINDLSTQLAALTGNSATEEPVATPATTDEGEIDNSNPGAEETSLLGSLLLPIIVCVALLIIAGGVIWSAVSAAQNAREAKKSNDERNSKHQSLKSMDQSLDKLSRQADPASAIDKAMMDPVSKTPYMKSIAADAAEARATLGRMEQKTDFASQPEQRPTDPYTVKRREVIALANSLAGIAAREDWANIILEKGYRYVLVQTSATDRDAMQEDKTGNSILACLMKGAEAEEAYLVPSFEDPNAGEYRWKDFYTVTDDPSVQHYRIDEPAVMKVVNSGTFFTLDTKGKLSRRP